jgi:hypothetical protein
MAARNALFAFPLEPGSTRSAVAFASSLRRHGEALVNFPVMAMSADATIRAIAATGR